MAEGVLMPKEGITVESCIIGEWKKNVGDHVNVGDILFTYETDKAEFECESTASGTLLEKFYEDGDEVPCLVNVCAIGNPGEDTSALKNAPAASAAPAAPAAEAPKAAAPAAAAAPAGPCAQAVIMPKEGITVESCIIGEWKKNVGDPVSAGDVLFTYETDKAEFECESTASGTLLAKFFEDGDEVPCLANVCAVGNPGDAYEFLKPGAEAPAPAAAPAKTAPAGGTALKCPMPGKILKSLVKDGDKVTKNQKVLVLEAMKMENDIVAPTDGVISLLVKEGDDVVSQQDLAVIK